MFADDDEDASIMGLVSEGTTMREEDITVLSSLHGKEEEEEEERDQQ